METQIEARKILYKRVPKIKHTRQIVSDGVRNIYGFDLADYTGNEGGTNRGYILVLIDYYSRFLMTKVINHKTKAEIENALAELFDEYGEPENIHSDKESGLISSEYLKEKNINVYHTTGHDNAQAGGSPIAEAVIKTIRTKLQQWRDVTIGKAWKQHVKKVTDDYNDTVHSIFKTKNMTPRQAFEDEGDDLDQLHYENKVRHNLKVLNGSKENANLQEEAKVLIPRQKAQFEKGYTQKWDDKVLTIKGVYNTVPVTYQLSNGKFYYAEQLNFLSKEQAQILPKRKS